MRIPTGQRLRGNHGVHVRRNTELRQSARDLAGRFNTLSRTYQRTRSDNIRLRTSVETANNQCDAAINERDEANRQRDQANTERDAAVDQRD